MGVTGVAIITGAARGIGAETAIQLAARGWQLVLVDRAADDDDLAYHLASEGDLDATVAACGGSGVAVPVVADVRDQSAMDAAVATAVGRFGGLDAAVSVAGAVTGGREAWRTSDREWESMMSINLDGPWRLARAAIPALLERPQPRQGRYIAVTSTGGTIGLYLMAAYAAAKHGLVGLVRSLAAELAPHGITANCVAPGSTRGPLLDASAAVYDLSSPEEFASHHLLPRLLEPAEPAALIAWLCGPESSGLTGAVVPVDAGMTAR
ncbi:MAG TPA: mycofactocin-coupled SDR family oxidoreductase [Acidimicrobiales bacterium]|nr:mycofactocin-coupled SDR family oxidoreductase [Acidimicrobiales bacterium]